jgi:hypothetical protein
VNAPARTPTPVVAPRLRGGYPFDTQTIQGRSSRPFSPAVNGADIVEGLRAGRKVLVVRGSVDRPGGGR